MRVLVTGHLGYIGTVLVPMLEAAGHDVVGLDCDLYRRCTFGPGLPRMTTVLKDVRDVEREDVRGFDAVLHLAALSNDPLGDLDPDLTEDVNWRASVRLAEMAKHEGVRRFVFSSSCSTYGKAGEDVLDESAAFNPITPYGRTKVWVERDVSPMASPDFVPTYLRNATAYGVTPRHRFDVVLNNLVAHAVTTGRILVKSDGTPWRPLVHVRDIARAFLSVLETPEDAVRDEAFNIGRTSENHRVRDLAEIVRGAVPECTVEYAEGGGPDPRSYRVSCEKAATTLRDFTPTWDAEAGARECLEAYRAHGLTLEEFEGPRYQRIAHVRELLRTGVLDQSLRPRVPVGEA